MPAPQVFEARGRRDGPRLALLGGLRDDDYSSIAAVLRVVRSLDRRRLAGTFVAVPVAAAAETDELVAGADAVLVLAAGGPGEAVAPFARFGSGGGGDAEALALAVGFPFLVRDEQVERTVVVAAGSCGRLDEDAVALLTGGVGNALRHLRMLTGEPRSPVPPPRLVRLEPVLCPVEGWWGAAVQAGEEVVEGTLLGRVRSLHGDALADVRSPGDGVVCVLATSPPVAAGTRLVGLGADASARV